MNSAVQAMWRWRQPPGGPCNEALSGEEWVMTRRREMSRRKALSVAAQGIGASSVLAAGFPSIVPAFVFGATAPSNRINVGAIGTGRISRTHDMPNVWKYDDARIVAVCDLDSRRMEDAKTLVNGYYSRKTGQPYDGVTGY